MEPILTKKITLDDLTKVDFNSKWHLHEMLAALQNAAQNHSISLGCGYYALREKNLAWVLCRMRLLIGKLPSLGETATIKTWPGQPQKILYPRYYSVTNESGEELIRASSIWILLDLTSRKISNPELDFYQGGFVFERPNMELPEKLRMDRPLLNEVWRTPTYSEIDANGHLNNAHYLKWISELFDWRRFKLNRMADIQINYVKEIKPSTPVRIAWETKQNITSILATLKDETACFEASVTWE